MSRHYPELLNANDPQLADPEDDDFDDGEHNADIFGGLQLTGTSDYSGSDLSEFPLGNVSSQQPEFFSLVENNDQENSPENSLNAVLVDESPAAAAARTDAPTSSKSNHSFKEFS